MLRISMTKNGLADWWEICWLAKWSEVNMVNLARSAVLCCTITTLICGLTSLLRLSCILLSLNREAHRNNRQRCLEMLTFSSTHYSSRVTKTKAKRRFWIRPGPENVCLVGQLFERGHDRRGVDGKL